MKVENLQINDWVRCKGKCFQVTSISILGGDAVGVLEPFSSHELVFADNAVALENGASKLSDLDFIELTPEILEKNGWKYDDLDGTFYGAINVFGRKAPFSIFDGISITYVHQLQNALRLHGCIDINLKI